MPELTNPSPSSLMELGDAYPPRLVVYVKQTESDSGFNLHVIGLDIECSFVVQVIGEKSSQWFLCYDN